MIAFGHFSILWADNIFLYRMVCIESSNKTENVVKSLKLEDKGLSRAHCVEDFLYAGWGITPGVRLLKEYFADVFFMKGDKIGSCYGFSALHFKTQTDLHSVTTYLMCDVVSLLFLMSRCWYCAIFYFQDLLCLVFFLCSPSQPMLIFINHFFFFLIIDFSRKYFLMVFFHPVRELVSTTGQSTLHLSFASTYLQCLDSPQSSFIISLT